MIVIQNTKRQSGFKLPIGGEVIWYGLSTNIPVGWAVITETEDAFIMGADEEGADDTPSGTFTHSHTNPENTSTAPAHTHPITGDIGNTGSGSVTFYGSGSNSTARAGHGHGDGSSTSSSSGAHSHTLSGTQETTTYPPYCRAYWITSSEGAVFPVGGIVMWDDEIAFIPEGFKICNGANGTPDLRNRFIYGASDDGHLGDTGGETSHTHENSNTGGAGVHTHTANVTSGGASSSSNGSGYAGVTVSAGGHTHGQSITTDSDPDHSHTVGNTLSSSSLPPYLMLYFIMRTE